MIDNRGQVRFSTPLDKEGMPAVGPDVSVDVMQADGTWVPLRGVCSAVITITPYKIVTAEIILELGAIDLTTIPDFILQDSRPQRKWWHRFRFWRA